MAAATAAANAAGNACAAVRPFYWELGDAREALTSGQVGGATYAAGTVMSIASASKWLYGAYVVEKRAGAPTASDTQFLSLKSGYTEFDTCLPGQTVATCLAAGSNGVLVPTAVDRFAYGGGHMQKHATLMDLGAMDNAALAAELRSALGSDIAMIYSQPQPAGGAVSTASDYARFLRKLLTGSLHMGTILGQPSVCTHRIACPTEAIRSPITLTEQWRYSLGYWIEADPLVGDGAFSSAGAFGFYPWIDATRSWYGVLARRDMAPNAGYDSARCGRLIRKAWVSGTAETP